MSKGSTPRPLSISYSQYQENYDNIFKKEILHNAEEWSKIKDIVVLDPDGWDRNHGPEAFQKSWDERINEEEFEKRAAISTTMRNVSDIQNEQKKAHKKKPGNHY